MDCCDGVWPFRGLRKLREAPNCFDDVDGFANGEVVAMATSIFAFVLATSLVLSVSVYSRPIGGEDCIRDHVPLEYELIWQSLQSRVHCDTNGESYTREDLRPYLLVETRSTNHVVDYLANTLEHRISVRDHHRGRLRLRAVGLQYLLELLPAISMPWSCTTRSRLGYRQNQYSSRASAAILVVRSLVGATSIQLVVSSIMAMAYSFGAWGSSE